ncbi:Succinate dehydrogenase/fumarate reductase, flavoprotein subunit [Altererythrobacter xiamenensis]|uniref:Succinate dehydrogenase/fumarate reductase, flavoprotein subunit n=1 Tax=Altererythrobacter xiamenensis TaxID=1316679 RepID=A0A1Y6F2U0_9SPHN|nr:FAD-dependent oxidoreductase [Altererythrobacter xiamenensis]SMQ69165.1 Succinate dehydrogenase/fumarate reductase, flavoprotein subunit [Altererythrobacter xiamenensis]
MQEVDVIVLGCGAAGMTAALAAHETGAEVAIIERFDRIGGTSAVSGGVIWVPDNPRQRASGLSDSREEALAYFKALDHGDLVDETLEAFVDRGPEALAFLEDIGALKVALLDGYPDYYLDRPGAKPEGGRALDHDLFALGELGEWAGRITAIEEPKPMMLRETPLGGGNGLVDPEELQRRMANNERGFGQAMVGRLLKACLERGIEPILGVETRALLRDGDQVTGIEGVRGGEAFELRARRGVVISTGGFEWDEEKRQAFLRGPMDAPASPPTARGDGLSLAMQSGAKLGNMTQAWWAPTLVVPDNPWPEDQFAGEQRAMPVLIERTVPHSLMVNRKAERFCNEAANYSALAGAFHQFDPQSYDYPNLPAWLIFDENYVERYPIGPRLPGQPVPDWVTRADTLGELAESIGLDGSTLEATVSRFNAHAEAGHDPDFERGTSAYDHFYGDRSRDGTAVTLGPVARAPFYAVEIRMGLLGTNGGARTDGAAHILGHDGEPIAGLFGAGNAIACPTGGIYAGAGGTLGPALTFGYIAGRSAARANA